MKAIANLPGYHITEQLYIGTRTIVYRGIRINDQHPVAIKLLLNEYPSFNDLMQFRNQYTITKNLDFPGIIKTLKLELYGNSYALILEDFGGISLSDYLKFSSPENINNKHLSLEKFLPIAINLTETLHYLYQNRIIHKDIKPANILINPHTKQIKLIDFSISSLLPKETQEIQNPNILEGTLAYISPEQTGRMNRGIDYRTDFYSLGVTFYELLTGKLPFISEDQMELVHCHLAKKPIPIHEINPDIPIMVSAIVTKLMKKNAENRYQSALGIKHDLEKCLHQFQAKGQIEYFPICQRDISDRFIISEKLYGRETEVNKLLEAFERVSLGVTELMLVAGFSGIGKTAVINEVHKPIVKQRGYFIKGKFDQFNRNIPFNAFVQAFRDLMGQLLAESDSQLQNWKTQILNAVGDNGQVLIDVIPELENIIGKQTPALELSGIAAQNRFNLLFQKFIQVFTTKEHPLVIFLDDLQWADSASLNLLKLLIMEESGYLLILGAYRNNEVSPVHPLILTLDEVAKTEAKVNTITLLPLKESDLNQLIADTLKCEVLLAETLTKLVYQKTKGNPFFATQFIKALHDDKLINFNEDKRYWQCDISQVEALAITDDVVEFMVMQLQKLPTETQEILKLAACIGAQFDLNTLAIVSEKSSVNTAIDLWKALQEGLIIPTNKIYKFFTESDREEILHTSANPTYRFLHDRVQQAAYSLIPNEQKQHTHYQIGQLLQQNLSEIEKTEKIFDIVGHLNLAIDLITLPEKREELAQLNLAAAIKARHSTAYSAAKRFVQTGLELLTENCWHNQHELTLNLYVNAAKTAYLNSDFEDMQAMAHEVLTFSTNILDKVKIYKIQINALSAQSKMLEAISVGQIALTQLGLDFSSEIDEKITSNVLESLAKKLKGKEIEELINLPVMSDRQTIAAIKILALLFVPTFLGKPSLLPLLCTTMVNLSLQFGNAPASTIGYVGYGMVLSAFLGEVEKGYRFGKLALSLVNRLNAQELKPINLLLFCSFLQHRQEALRSSISSRKEAYITGMETGNFLDAAYSIVNYFYDIFLAGVELESWEAEMENYAAVLAKIKQDSPVNFLNILQETVYNLKTVVNQPYLLIGSVYDETIMFPKYHQDNELTAFVFAYTYKLMLAYLFGNYTHALEYINQAKIYLMVTVGVIHIPVFHFYAGLTYLASLSNQSEIEQANTFDIIENYQNILAQWAKSAPMNHQHKVDLITAEKCRVLGNNYEAGDWYDRAIAGAKINQYIQEEALANELAAKFYLAWGKEKIAAGYMQEAYYCYTRWGAKAKVIHLEKSYPQLLIPILQTYRNTNYFQQTISPIKITSNKSSTSISQAIDLATLLKASQAISGKIELDKLISTLLEIVIANAGATKCVLLLKQELDLKVEALLESGKIAQRFPSIPLELSPDIPINLVNTVKRTLKPVVLIDARLDKQFAADIYLQKHQPKSIFCSPILNQGNLIGILYLENNLTIGAFTSDRIEVLNLIASQAAISLENARLYQAAQQALIDLKQAQIQIVQNEKMSALGNLVAGIAHEINNPIGFLNGNIQPALDYINDLLSLIDLYQEKYSDPDIQAEIANIELEYLREDLPKIVGSMREGVKRIKEISNSLRIFSRADKDYPVACNIHDGIDSTIMILKHRLKAKETHPEIKIIKDYGNLPEIECYAGQLNQVFMNILSNAIDALEEANQGKNYQEINNQINIKTELSTNQKQVIIRIKDNGIGMSQEIQEKIFEHLFTTKAVGKGTGLGLAIARQIIEEKHRGNITFSSTPGIGTEFTITLSVFLLS